MVAPGAKTMKVRTIHAAISVPSRFRWNFVFPNGGGPKAALACIDVLMDEELGTPEGDELDILGACLGLYEPARGAALPHRTGRIVAAQPHSVPRRPGESLRNPLGQASADDAHGALRANHGIPADLLLQQPGAELPNALGDQEWDSVGHQPKMHVARKPIKLCDGDGAARGACFGESGGTLRPTIERVAALAGFDLDE